MRIGATLDERYAAPVPNVGPLELLVIGIIALIVLGPKRLPDFGRSVGRGLREFRQALSGAGDERELQERDEQEPEGEGRRTAL
jgi:sec-independent protein translocase protein TatA